MPILVRKWVRKTRYCEHSGYSTGYHISHKINAMRRICRRQKELGTPLLDAQMVINA